KCLEKDRNRRYETANGLARDIERYLHDEPVQACPPSAWYRFRKFARRYRQALATATLLGVMMLVTLTAVLVLLWRENEWTADALNQQTRARERVERSLYFQSIARADLEWWTNNIGRAAQILVESPAAYRHWEWHYLKRRCHAELFTLTG